MGREHLSCEEVWAVIGGEVLLKTGGLLFPCEHLARGIPEL